MADKNNLIELVNIHRAFWQGGERLNILNGVDLSVKPGETISLVGPSGSGKSTLLHIAGLLEKPDDGEIHILNKNVSSLSDKKLTQIRNQKLGFIYQYHYLLSEFSALENIMLPQLIAGKKRGIARERAITLLSSLNLGDRIYHRPYQLSGGEQQRVAIGRALANDPQIILADEPTGNLDFENAEAVFSMLLKQSRQAGVAAIIATHNLELAKKLDRIFLIENGSLLSV